MPMLDVVSVGASIVALGAVAWSAWLLRRQVAVAAVGSVDALFLAVAHAYFAYPELRTVFNEGEGGLLPPVLDRPTSQRAATVAETLADAMERALMRSQSGLPSSAAPSLRPWISDSFRSSAFFRIWLNEHRAWYSDELVGLLDDARRAAGEATC